MEMARRGATIHRGQVALDAMKSSFKNRINPDIQAPKMADFWPIENVWAIIKARIASKNTNTLKDLRKEIISAWKEIDADKDLCKKLIHSIPAREKAIIQKYGDQIFKNDY